MSRLLCSLTLFSFLLAVLAAGDTPTDGEPVPAKFAIGGFVPSKSLSTVALFMYGASALINWIQFFLIGRKPFMLTLTIGMTTMTAGFVVRLIDAETLDDKGIYIIMQLLILLSPCAFLATDYVLLARLAATFDEQVTKRCLLVRQTRIVKFFVWSDVITFLLQAAGGSLTIGKNKKMADLGNTLAIIGLVLQLLSFCFFIVVLVIFGWRLSRNFPNIWAPQKPRPWSIFSAAPIDDWRVLFYAICATCIGIVIRSIFRIAEYVGGHDGYISTHESLFYLLDALPLWICMGLFIFVWPVRCLNGHPGQTELPLTSRELK
ncbi:RTA1 like protein-domain-containing protein [Mycena rebaudengoi]|nr:RTA1 like protein-domain-containing protein [Mycena rebaudengoi]